jgi:uncharacterized protein (DUF1330 family)
MTAGGSPRPGSPLTLVALLWLRDGREAEYKRFETEASRIMGRHGGRIARRIKVARGEAPAGVDGPAAPDEVHIVEFADAAAFARYRADPEIQALAELRAAAIRETVVWQGREAAAFASDAELFRSS